MPVDTPIVIARMVQDGPIDDIAFALRDAGGEAVALREVMRIPPAYLGCGAAELLFLRPQAPLEPDAAYQIEFDIPRDPGQSDSPLEPVPFRTGQGLFEPEPPIEATERYVTLRSPRCEGGVCPAMAQVRVELSSRPSTPVWLSVRSYEPRYGTYVQRLRPSNLPVRPEESPTDWAWTAGVKLGDSSSCIQADIYGVEGTSLHQWSGCEPDGCAITDRWAGDSCGGPPKSAVETLRIHDGTCANPPLLDATTDGGIAYPDDPDAKPIEAGDDAGASDPDQAGAPSPRRDAGCNVTRGASAGHGSSVAALLIAWLISHRRRRTQ